MGFNLHDIGRKFGQRAHNRILIPGAAISWKPSHQESFPEAKLPLSDISAGGLAFLTNDPPDVRSEISILILLPQNADAFELLGEVKYSATRGPRLTYKYRVGVELRPFEQAGGCNSLEALDRVKALEKKFSKQRGRGIGRFKR